VQNPEQLLLQNRPLKPPPTTPLLQVCDEQLLQNPEQLLLEKEHSGCERLLLDNKARRTE
jgi:hypothetical protein